MVNSALKLFSIWLVSQLICMLLCTYQKI